MSDNRTWACLIHWQLVNNSLATLSTGGPLITGTRPNQLNGYCDGTVQDDTPQILSYATPSFGETGEWEYLGEPWPNSTWPEDPDAHVPRVECPYQFEDASASATSTTNSTNSTTVLKLSLAGTGRDYCFVGTTDPTNGSALSPIPPPLGGAPAPGSRPPAGNAAERGRLAAADPPRCVRAAHWACTSGAML